MSNEVRERWVESYRDLAVAMCPPAVRMVVVRAWSWTDEGGRMQTADDICPVVALRSAVGRRYTARTRKGCFPDDGGPEKGLPANGWTLDGQEARTTALIVDATHGLVAWDDRTIFGETNQLSELVCCPWAPAEDEARLRDVVSDLRKRAAEREAGRHPNRNGSTHA